MVGILRDHPAGGYRTHIAHVGCLGCLGSDDVLLVILSKGSLHDRNTAHRLTPLKV